LSRILQLIGQDKGQEWQIDDGDGMTSCHRMGYLSSDMAAKWLINGYSTMDHMPIRDYGKHFALIEWQAEGKRSAEWRQYWRQLTTT